MSVAPKAALAQGSPILLRSRPCQMPNTEP